MENRFDSKMLVSFVIQWTLYIMLFLVISGCLLEVFTRQNHIGVFNAISSLLQGYNITFVGLFYTACIVVCASPFVSVIVFIIGYVINKNYKAAGLGVLLLLSLSISLVYAVMVA